MREKCENSCRSETTFRRNFKRDYGERRERKGRNWESREDDNEFPRGIGLVKFQGWTMIHVAGIPRISRFKEKLSGSRALKASATRKS